MPQKQAKSGGAKKIGNRLKKCALYRSRGTRYENKMRRIRQSNGKEAANRYRLADMQGRRAAV